MQYMASQNALSIPDGNVVVELLVKESSCSLGRRRRDHLVRVLWSPEGHFLKQNFCQKKNKIFTPMSSSPGLPLMGPEH